MTLLELIANASSDQKLAGSLSAFPVILKPDYSLLKPKDETANPASLARPVDGLQLLQNDIAIDEFASSLSENLRQVFKDRKDLNSNGFVGMLVNYLQRIKDRAEIAIKVSEDNPRYEQALIENVGFLMGEDITGMVLEVCIAFELWELVSSMIVSGIVPWSAYSNLVLNLIVKRRSDLISLCIKHAPDLKFTELCCILKYFLCPPGDAHTSMVTVRQEWNKEGQKSIVLVSDGLMGKEKMSVAREAAILLMLAIDGFSDSELCLHYLLASSNIDETTLSSAIRKLNGEELMSLIRYLGKWVRKYERFPQATPCPKAGSVCKLGSCDWVPKLEDVIRWLGLVLDENFSSLVLHPEFHEELRAIERLTSSFTAEAWLCTSLASILETLTSEDTAEAV